MKGGLFFDFEPFSGETGAGAESAGERRRRVPFAGTTRPRYACRHADAAAALPDASRPRGRET